MVTFQSLRKSFLPNMNAKPAAPNIASLRELCFTLLADVPASDRKAMLQRIENMRRAEDTWHLRSALFDVISLAHGEATARVRLARLDERLG
jgi:hypothetical protein